MITVIGFLASTMSIFMTLPQAYRTFRWRNDVHALMGVSIMGQVLIVCNATLWFMYAFLDKDIWIGLPGVVNLPLACFTIFWVARAHQKQHATNASFDMKDPINL